jgi:hypothetical protein
MRNIRRYLAIGLAMGMSMAVGCSPQDRLYNVSGKVTVNGRPVPAGLIFFDPNTARGTSGTQGFANIKDGQFTTAEKGRGIRGGAYTVRISGFDGKAADEAPMGQSLFDEYQESRDLPRADSTLDINIVTGGK